MPRPTPLPASPDEVDDLDELPALDGDSDDPEEDGIALDESVDVGEDDSDDSTGEDEPADPSELEVDPTDDGWIDESADAADLDIGDSDLIDIEGAEREEAGAPADDAADRDVDEPSPFDPGDSLLVDPGDEGPIDEDEALRDQDLPPLDADEEGADDGDLTGEALDDGMSEEPSGLPWAAQPWIRVGAPLGLVEATALALVPRGALVATAGESGELDLVRVDLEGTCEPLVGLAAELRSAAGIVALASEGSTLVVVVSDGRVLVSRDAGLHFEAVAAGVGVAQAVLLAGAIWLRTRAGALLVIPRDGKDVVPSHVPGAVVSLVRLGGPRSTAGGLRALAVDARGRPLSLVTGTDDAAFTCEPIDAPEAHVAPAFAARGRRVAYAAPKGVVRREPGGAWRLYRWDGRVTALAFIDDEGALVAATYSDADDTTGLVLLDRDGRASLVGRIGASPRMRVPAVGSSLGPTLGPTRADGHALALACDDARAVVWLAGGFGLATFAIPTR